MIFMEVLKGSSFVKDDVVKACIDRGVKEITVRTYLSEAKIPAEKKLPNQFRFVLTETKKEDFYRVAIQQNQRQSS